MANLVVLDDWKKDAMTYLVNSSMSLVMGLYDTAGWTWAHDFDPSVISECSFTGYARQTCTGWTSPALDGSNDAYVTGTEVSFTNTGATNVDVYGLFYYDVYTSHYVSGQNFPITITLAPGMALKLVPELQDQSQF